MLKNRHIVFGVTGGIAAYKACEAVSRLRKLGAEVRVVMSAHSTEFVAPLTLETLSGNAVYTDAFDRKFEIEHVALAKWADMFVVAPATANFIGKFACGIADDLISTTAMAMTCPVLIAPAMNTAMWKNPACQANMNTLISRGIYTIGPESGHLACGDDDVGRMSEAVTIVEKITSIMCRAEDLKGLNVLVTAGATIEMIDPVRYITNRSTGKMGYAIAEIARDRGANVTLVTGKTNIAPPSGVNVVNIVSSADLCEAVLARAAANDIIIQSAAPADFTPETVADRKIKKDGEYLTLRLKPTTDIAREVGKTRRVDQTIVIFAAETNDVIENARGKLARKNADMVVANDVTREGAGFGTDTNAVTLITKDDSRDMPLMTKRAVADAIFDRILEIRNVR